MSCRGGGFCGRRFGAAAGARLVPVQQVGQSAHGGHAAQDDQPLDDRAAAEFHQQEVGDEGERNAQAEDVQRVLAAADDGLDEWPAQEGGIHPGVMGHQIGHGQEVQHAGRAEVVLVDGVEYLNHTFDTVDSYYNDAYVGLGLWDGDLEVQNLFVTNPHASKVNKEDLQKAVDKANDVDTSLYTEETVRAYQEALAQAKQVLSDENVEQSAVDKAAQNLNDAFGKLSAKLVYQVTPDEGVKELVFSKPAVNIITETIPFKRQERTNPNLKQGLRRLITAGKNGLRRILVEVSGDDRRVIEDSTVDSAIDEIVEVGTQTAFYNEANNQQTVPSHAATTNEASAVNQLAQTTTTDTSAKTSDGSLPNTGVVDQVAVSAGLTLLGSGLVAGSRKKKRDKLD